MIVLWIGIVPAPRTLARCLPGAYPCSLTLPPLLDQEAHRSHRAVCVRLREWRIAHQSVSESSGVSLTGRDGGTFVWSSARGEIIAEVVKDGGLCC
jgi:hypothetical protein